MTAKPSFYVTTAIDYVNGKPHLGHAYEKVTTCAIARYKRLRGYDVWYLTGTDEHGSKVQRAADAEGISPQEYVDRLAPEFKSTWDLLNVSYDEFIRTTEDRHAAVVQELLQRLKDRDRIYENDYEGWYCAGCEAFITEKELVDGKCNIHKVVPERIKESNLFFRLSEYTEPLLAHLKEHPEFIEPATRRNEILSVLEGGLRDISMSRQTVQWGVPVPFKEGATVYVWFDALINYISALGLSGERFDRFWPADLHAIGKDITRFHCIYWPAMLMAAGIELPKQVFGHGFVLSASGDKLSKSAQSTLGDVSDPLSLAKRLGADPLRWYLCSEIFYGRDGEFGISHFEEVYTSHLAKNMGNLFSRVLNMVARYRGKIPAPKPGQESAIDEAIEVGLKNYLTAMDSFALHDGCNAARNLSSILNEQIHAREPFRMAKDESKAEELDGLLFSLVAGIRLVAIMIQPFIPESAQKILSILGDGEAGTPIPGSAAEVLEGVAVGHTVTKPEPLFPFLKKDGN